MQDENVVRELYVSGGNRAVKASYFIEAGIVHASIKERSLTLPVGTDSSEETVPRLIIGQLEMRKWRERIVARWHTRGGR